MKIFATEFIDHNNVTNFTFFVFIAFSVTFM